MWLHQTPCPEHAVVQDVWPEVLRCISRFELLSQMAAGGITDMALFAPPTPEPASPSGFTKLRRGLFASGKPAKPEGAPGATQSSCWLTFMLPKVAS